MNYFTIFLFFIYSWGLGYSVSAFVNNSSNLLERNLMRIGIGLGIIPVIGVILNILHIPIDWKIFLILSLIIPIFFLIKNIKKIKIPLIKLTKSNLYFLFVLILFFLTLFMYEKGSFAYPYLEDDDSWQHTLSVKYVAFEKNVNDPIPEQDILQYVDPYPPGYAILFGILHQTSTSLNWTLKFFNSLIISLGILFFYFFAKEFIGNKIKALFVTFVLASIPCYLSHFIWSHSYIATLFFPAMYCLERIKYDKKWCYIGALVISGILLIQPTTAIKLGIMFGIYFLIKCFYEKKFLKWIFLALLLGLIISMIWWIPNAKDFFGVAETGAASKGKSVFGPNTGTATRPYNFNDFFIAKKQNMINNPLGVGVILSILLIITLIYLIFNYKNLKDKNNAWITITLIWLIFTFLGINSMTFKLPVGLYAFRFWMLFAIPVSILSSEGTWFLMDKLKKIGIGKIITILIIIIGILFTSAYQKYTVNTAQWPPGTLWSSIDELQGYLYLNSLPINEKVFPVCSMGARKVLGFDKLVYFWKLEGAERKQYDERIELSVSDLNNWLKSHSYKYLIIDGNCIKEDSLGLNKTNEKINELGTSGLFAVEHQTKGMILFKAI